jgi:hypothetical protein
MEEKSILKSLLKGIFGSGKVYSEPTQADPPPEPPTLAAPPAIVTKTPKPKSQAYLNRKKGRPVHGNAYGYWQPIFDCIVRHGEVTPGAMVQELGLPKSTLIYNLNQILRVCEGKGGYDETPKINRLLAGKRVERVGAGKYVRYRVIDAPKAEPAVEPSTPEEG